MAKTLVDLVAEIRDLMQDARESSYRYSNARLIRQINTTFREIYRMRPDAFTGCCAEEAVELPNFTEEDLAADPAVVFPIDELFFQAAVFHVVAVTELSDDEFAVEGRAISLMNAFRQQLVGV